MGQNTKKLLPILQGQSVIPVLLIDHVEDAVPLARALAKGGLKAIEVTLRTKAALGSIEAIAKEVPEAIVGAGTILNAEHYETAEKAGAKFIVSPGLTGELIDVAEDSDIPLLPGAITPSEIMSALEEDYEYLKFFPAESAGGISFMKSLASPFQGVKFCPTGGIDQKNVADWLNLANVVCVGGSWVAPKDLIEHKKWDEITKLSQATPQIKN